MAKGRVYIVGAGPGSPDLITIRGLEVLAKADVVIYDYLVDKRLLLKAKQNAKLICCDELGRLRHSDGFLVHQERINDIMVRKAKQSKIVVRLKNGDPSIFSRLSQELDALVKNKIEFEIIPGVTAASATSCLTGIPLTDRRFASSCVFATGHEGPLKKTSFLDWDSLAKSGTIVLYMAIENLSGIVKQLLRVGKSPDTPCAIVCDAALPTQKVLIGTLNDISARAKEQNIAPPAIIIIGEVVGLGERFNWVRKLPLFGKRILITSSIESAIKFAKMLEGYGATTYILPTVEPRNIDPKKLDWYINNIGSYDWVIFLSQNGARVFFERLKTLDKDIRVLSGIKFCAIGPKTKEVIENFGVKVEVIPKRFCKEAILEAFKRINISNRRILIVCSNLSGSVLTDGLKALGARVDYVWGYIVVLLKSHIPQIKELLKDRHLDLITFTSPSCVHGFMNGFKKAVEKRRLNSINFAVIGPVTGSALAYYGIKTNIQPRDYTVESLTREIVNYYRRNGGQIKPRLMERSEHKYVG
ncbi:MAG: uroporphyrinogen-III C-methyltransferase [Candidatus Omnitrophica bacterium]|nr:uroporphyrinogen-III C-methyltransferase [Candidatus Omnitrophota bacterium]